MKKTVDIENKIDLLKSHVRALTEHILPIIDLSETNKLVVYSDTISSQIPQSYAARSFNVLTNSLHFYAIVCICSIWGKSDEDDQNLQTVAKLLEDDFVIDLLCIEEFKNWADDLNKITSLGGPFSSSKRPLRHSLGEVTFAIERACKRREKIKSILSEIQIKSQSNELLELTNYRHKKIAHKLVKTRLEKNFPKPIPDPKYADEEKLIDFTIKLIEDLYVNVCSTSFDIDNDYRTQSSRCAKEFWKNLKFQLPD